MPARKRLAAALSLGVAFTGLQLVSAPSATAVSTGLVISEVYGGGGNTGAVYTNDYVELSNPTPSAIPVDGMSVQYRSGTNTGTGVAALTGSVPANGRYLVQLAAGTTVTNKPLPTPDATNNGVNMSGTAGTVFLANGTSVITLVAGDNKSTAGVVDLVGYASTTYETTTAAGLSNTTVLTRTAADNDVNSAEFSAGTTFTPTNAAGETAPPTPALAATDPGDKTWFVGTPIPTITLAAVGGTSPYTWGATGLPPGVTVTGNQISGTPTTAVGATDVVLTVTDSATPTPGTDTETFAFTVEQALETQPIAAIQGTGPVSPVVGTTVTTEGVVTALYRTGGLNGMFIQTGGTGGSPDATPDASDAIFVYGSPNMGGIPAGIAIGDSVEVTGAVSEFNKSTQITPALNGTGVVELDTPLAAVTARAIAYPTTEVAREAQEGMLLAPTDDLAVTNVFSTNRYAEIGLATGGTPLVQPTEVKRASDAAGLAAVKADNAARAVTLDDASSFDFLPFANRENMNTPLPYLSKTNPIRVGASATFNQPVILEYRNNVWKFQPRQQVTGDGTDVVTFEDTRTGNLAPELVPGDLKLATFNVLNYFNTTGEQYVANGAAQTPPVSTACSYYLDRENNPIANNTCGVVSNGSNAGNGPRGAANQQNFLRQQSKIVIAINALGADVVALEEIENSIKLVGEGDNRDDALSALVKALNAAAGPGTWRFVTSPTESVQTGAVALQDVIRSAFIYKPATVTPVGISDLYLDESANATSSTPAGVFSNAREPLAQAFKPKGALDSKAFAVVANHFKSKGDSNPPATGDNANGEQGAFSGDRVRQATKLTQFANAFAEARGIEAVFLAGDFNSYTEEDPMHVLYDAGYDPIESPGEETYSFSGLSGSLDHVLGNAAAMDMVVGADVWDINASESVAFQYSRYNYNAKDFWQGDLPFAASDHNPEIVGIDLPSYGTNYSTIQLVATNDFHGRLLADGPGGAGAAVLAGAVDQMRADNPDTVFAAAGDLIGASTFESFIQNDEPTIEALNEAGLEVSAAGNHEFDQGYADFTGRVQDHADWEYIAANVEEPNGQDKLAETWTKTFDTDAGDIKVGFVGAVTEDLPSLVSPAGIQGVTVTDIVDATNEAADDLKADGADLVVLLVHEGASQATYASATNESTAFGHIVNNVDADVDAIVSGHTHLAYNFAVPVPAWANRVVKKRPVVSAGQYGTNLNQLGFTYDNARGRLVAVSQDIVGVAGAGFEPDAEVVATVAAAKAQADVRGAVVLGKIAAPFNRAKLGDGTTENRGGESTLGNLVAEVQRWATRTPEAGAAKIAFMNPGGLRADMVGTVVGASRDLTYKQAAVVQPFANTLVNMDLTGAQIEKVLEQQWQRDGSGNVPSRAFLRLGVSRGFTYTYSQYDDPAKPGQKLGEVNGMWLDGVPLDPTSTYSVTVNSFLASGGDNFFELNNGTGRADTGKVDLQAMVDYLKANATDTPLPVKYDQRAVGATFPAGAPASYAPGAHVTFVVSSWSMSTAADAKDSELQVKLGDQVLGTFPVNSTIGTAQTDEYGTASVDVVLPAGTTGGAKSLTLVGPTTGTQIQVPIEVESTTNASTVSAANVSVAYGDAATVSVTVTNGATGTVQVLNGPDVLGTGTVSNGAASVTLAAKSLAPGSHTLKVKYLGDSTYEPSESTFTVTVAKAASTVSAGNVSMTYGKSATVSVTVASGATGTVRVLDGRTVLGTGSISNGKASVTLPATSLLPGSHTLTVSYAGDASYQPSQGTFKATVAKAVANLDVTVSPEVVKVDTGRAKVKIRVTAEGTTPTGTVVVKIPGGKELTATLVDGKATVKLPKFNKPGKKKLTITYLGSTLVESAQVKDAVKVVRR